MLTKRLMLHLMLTNGYASEQISTVLGLSRETVYKHINILRLGDEVYKSIIDKIAGRQKVKAFWKTIEKMLSPVGLMM